MEPLEELESNDEQSQLKRLIAKGKEQGFLTYAEVNDHLPDDIVDPEQIEDIINMINDMGITVHETAPDMDALLMAEPEVDEEAAEEAAAAIAAVDTEFGRTTDPVRMYMREMGTVDLLTREGEIKIAKRIEDGLNQVLSALADFPTVAETFLADYDRTAETEGKITDLIAGFIDYSTETAEVVEDVEALGDPEAAPPGGDDEEGGDEDSDPVPNQLDPEEVKAHFEDFRKLHKKVQAATKKNGRSHAKTQEARRELQEKFLVFKLVPRVSEQLAQLVRSVVEEIRQHEKVVMDICVKQCKIPRKDFLQSRIAQSHLIDQSGCRWSEEVCTQRIEGQALCQGRDRAFVWIGLVIGINRVDVLGPMAPVDEAEEHTERLIYVSAGLSPGGSQFDLNEFSQAVQAVALGILGCPNR